jgi:5-methylcytosine-specific restriction endonuclease McrA
MKRRRQTEETKRKIGDAIRGNKRPDLAEFNRTRTDLLKPTRCSHCGMKFRNHYQCRGHISGNHSRIPRTIKYSAERARKISRSLKGHGVSDETKRKISLANTGRKQPEELNLRRSLALRGSKNHQWRGGVYPEIEKQRKRYEYIRFKRRVLFRDGNRCQTCGARNRLVVHHVKSFRTHASGRVDPDNAIALCRSCHARLHRKKR